MRLLALVLALGLPLSTLAVYYPYGYTNTGATMSVPASTLPSFVPSMPAAVTSPRTNTLRSRICDPQYGVANRRLPSWCAAMAPVAPANTVVQSSRFTPENTFRYNVPQVTTTAYANVRAYRQSAPQTVSSAVVDVLQLDVHYPEIDQRVFQSALRLSDAKVRLTSSNNSNVRWSDFEVVSNGETYSIDPNGYATISLEKRLSPRDAIETNIGVRLRPVDNLPLYNGSFQLELLSISAYREGSTSAVTVKMEGDRRSQFFAFSPFPATQTSPFVQVITEGDNAQTLTGGGTFDLLRITIEPQFAGVSLDKIVIKNTALTDASQLFDRIYLVDAGTGDLLDSTTFSFNEATYRPLSELNEIQINNRRELVVRGLVRQSDLPLGAQVQLSVGASDIELRSLTSGTDISPGQINLAAGTSTLQTVADSTLIVEHDEEEDQPQVFVSNGIQETVYRFTFKNPGQQRIYLGRMTLNVSANGINFPAGSPQLSDFAVYSSQGNPSGLAPVAIASNGDITFDATSPIIIGGNEQREFLLRVATTQSGTNTDDSLVVLWRKDATASSGMLSSLQSSGALLIYTTDNQLQNWTTGNSLTVPYTAFVLHK